MSGILESTVFDILGILYGALGIVSGLLEWTLYGVLSVLYTKVYGVYYPDYYSVRRTVYGILGTVYGILGVLYTTVYGV